MRFRTLTPAAAAFVAAAPIACGTSVTMPTGPIGAGNVSGLWRGTGIDSQGATIVTWSLTQTGAAVSGTVKTQAVDPSDGSCSSCHRNKSGTFAGSIDGATMTLTMHFAAGADGDPTPACTTTLTGAASIAAVNQLTAVYSGADSCEGPLLNGNLPMMRQQ